MKPSELLGTAERARIEEAVREAERGTSGEIVVSVVRACDAYSAAPWRLGALLGMLGTLSLAFLPLPGGDAGHAIPIWWVVAVQAGAIAAAHALCQLDPVRRFLVSDAEVETRAQRQALRSFAEHGVRKTRERTGILIFIALFERRVVVLGDEAVDAALNPDESWQSIVDIVLDGMRQGRAAEGIIEAVRACGEILSHPLPPNHDDVDEIEHGLVLED